MKFQIGFRLGGRLLALATLVASGSQTLRQATSSTGMLVGAAVRPSLFSEAAYSATLSRNSTSSSPKTL